MDVHISHWIKFKHMVKELTDRQIPGITWKQIAAIIGGVAICCWMYFNIKANTSRAYDQSMENSETLKVILANQKENERVNNIRLTGIELDQREFKIRLSILEANRAKE